MSNRKCLSESAIEAVINLNEAARCTGRTIAMIEAAQPGDIIVTHKHRNMLDIQQYLQEAGKQVKVIADPDLKGPREDVLRNFKHTIHYDHEYELAVLLNFLQAKARQFTIPSATPAADVTTAICHTPANSGQTDADKV